MKKVDRNLTEVAAFLRRRRLRLGLTQKEISDQMGVSPTYFSAVEGGRANPSKHFVKAYKAKLQSVEFRREKTVHDWDALSRRLRNKVILAGLSRSKACNSCGLSPTILQSSGSIAGRVSPAVAEALEEWLDEKIAERKAIEDSIRDADVVEAAAEAIVEPATVETSEQDPINTDLLPPLSVIQAANGHVEPLTFAKLMEMRNPVVEPPPVFNSDAIRSINEQIDKSWDGVKAVVEVDVRFLQDIQRAYETKESGWKVVLRGDKFFFWRIS